MTEIKLSIRIAQSLADGSGRGVERMRSQCRNDRS